MVWPKIKREKQYEPKEFADMRAMFDSKDIDAVSMTTPNHWHALAAIWAMQAGKDVYVEKPASHNMYESQQIVKAARKYKRMVQVGSQSRSMPNKIKAIQLLQGRASSATVYHARGECFRRRFSIGHTPDEPVPAGLDWDKFLGPAQMKPYSKNQVRVQLALVLGHRQRRYRKPGRPRDGHRALGTRIATVGRSRSHATGGKFAWNDDQETPNTQQATFDFGDAQMTFEVRNLPTPPEGGVPVRGPNYVGNIFFGTGGFLVVDHSGFEVYKSTAGKHQRGAARGSGAGLARSTKR